ncbi:MAG TPA: pilus assembly protein PilM [Oculatellaceae cyanobacterium]|jgi:Tfp pilus assembly PilM family ATPase
MTAPTKKSKPAYAGLSITRHAAELAIFSPKTMAIESAASIPIPPGVFDRDGDSIYDPDLLKDLLGQLLRSVRPRPNLVHLSLPGTLLRLVEMPKMEPAGLYVSLSSEAERYKTFDNAEAVVDFCPVPHPNQPPNRQQVVFGAVRSDTLTQYLKILKGLKVKTASISLEPLTVLRAMAGTGVLDGLVQQIGTDAYWGLILVEATRVRLSIWQCDQLVELRETAMETQDFAMATPDSMAVEDLLEEIRRTTKAVQPTVWLSHDLPPAMQQVLSEKLGYPIYPAPLGQGLTLSQPLQLSTVGAALSSMVEFPFQFDILAGLTHSGGGGASSQSSSAAPQQLAEEVSGSNGGSLIPLGLGSLVVSGLVTGGLFVAAMMVQQQIPELEAKRDNIKMEVSALEARQQELKKKAELDRALLDMIQQSKIRNRIYVALTDDLRNKTPEKIWIRSLTVDNALQLDGKALSHQSVINFARSFDEPVYARDIVIKSIKEGRLGGTLVFDFSLSGRVNLDPSILDSTTEVGSAGNGGA